MSLYFAPESHFDHLLTCDPAAYISFTLIVLVSGFISPLLFPFTFDLSLAFLRSLFRPFRLPFDLLVSFPLKLSVHIPVPYLSVPPLRSRFPTSHTHLHSSHPPEYHIAFTHFDP